MNVYMNCKRYKFYTMIELTFLKELMLIKQANQKSAIFVTIRSFVLIVYYKEWRVMMN